MVQQTQVRSVLKTSECYLQEYVTKNGGVYLKMLMSPLQDVSRLSRDQINNKKYCMFIFCMSIFVHIFPDIRMFLIKQDIPYMNFIIKRRSNTNLNSLFYYYILSNFGKEIVEF